MSGFSLKDHLFNTSTITQLADEIAAARSPFAHEQFIDEVVGAFPALELKQRISHITDCLYRFLPHEYEAAVQIILRALPAPLDPTLHDDDFGSFIHVPYGEYIARYGCHQHLLAQSFAALEQITMRCSVEFAIRTFAREFPEQTYRQMLQRAIHPNYHVRRLASEGSRPTLPRGTKINRPLERSLSLLEILRSDPTSYVRRSVANHLHDRSKKYPDAVISVLARRRQSGQGQSAMVDKLIRHALRSSIKQGDRAALALVGHDRAILTDCRLSIDTPIVHAGEHVIFTFDAISGQDQVLHLTYTIYFPSLTAKPRRKIFVLKQRHFAAGERIHIVKRHMIQNYSTRKLMPGIHSVVVSCHGEVLTKGEFMVKSHGKPAPAKKDR